MMASNHNKKEPKENHGMLRPVYYVITNPWSNFPGNSAKPPLELE